MPKTNRAGRPKAEELPGTVRRSEPKAQRTFAKVHDAAASQYGEGERAYRTAYGALKHSYERVGDRWEPKGHRGPSDEQAARGGANRPRYPTAGGVDARASKAHLYQVARRLGIAGRSTMSKDQLVAAIQRANERSRAAADRGSG